MNSLQSIPSHTRNSHQFGALVERYRALISSLQTTKLLGQLARALQQHRGATMGWLSGQPRFGEQASALQQRIEKLFALLEAMQVPGDVMDGVAGENAQFEGIALDDELRIIRNDWLTIEWGWKKDQLMHNFEFHSHLIDSLLRLLRKHCYPQVAAIASAAVTDAQRAENDGPETGRDSVVFDELPMATETLAQLRGLCTNVAVHKACAKTNRAKIDFLLSETLRQHRALSQRSKLDPNGFCFPYGYNSRFRQFIREIKSTILDTDSIDVNSASLFSASTAIIDQLWLMVDDNLLDIEQRYLQLLLD